MNFGEAIDSMQEGDKVSRSGWNGKDMWLMLSVPEKPYYTLEPAGKAYGVRPYIYMKAADDMLVPWTASQSDVLAVDWEVVV